jgi:hypothetical protein
MIYPISQAQKDRSPRLSHRWILNFTPKFPSTGRTAATAPTALSPQPRPHPITGSGRSISPWLLRTFLLPRRTATSCQLLDLRLIIYHRSNKRHHIHILAHIPLHRVSPPSLPLRNLPSFPQALHEKSPFRLPATEILRHHQVLLEARFHSVSVRRVNLTPLLHPCTPHPRLKATAFLCPPAAPSLLFSTPQRSSNPQMPTNPERAGGLLKSFINLVSSTVWDLLTRLRSASTAITPVPFPKGGNHSS